MSGEPDLLWQGMTMTIPGIAKLPRVAGLVVAVMVMAQRLLL